MSDWFEMTAHFAGSRYYPKDQKELIVLCIRLKRNGMIDSQLRYYGMAFFYEDNYQPRPVALHANQLVYGVDTEPFAERSNLFNRKIQPGGEFEVFSNENVPNRYRIKSLVSLDHI